MRLVKDKTHLLVSRPKNWPKSEDIPILYDNIPISESLSTEHLGIIRSSNLDNFLAIQDRISKHFKALLPVLACGAARGHRGNPAAALRVEALYASPVLFSGLASLVLSRSEIYILTKHHRQILQKIMRVFSKSPPESIYILSGVPPAEAILDLKMFNLLGMVARMGPKNPLHQIGVYLLVTHSSFSWFSRLRVLSGKYKIMDPLQILLNPPDKIKYNQYLRKRIYDFWHSKLINQMSSKSSLKFLRGAFLPLGCGPHPLWLSCEGSPTAIAAAELQAKILTGRYRDDYLVSKWKSSSDGACSLCDFFPGDISHYLTGDCPALAEQLKKTLSHSFSYLSHYPTLLQTALTVYNSSRLEFAAFIADPSTNPLVIKLRQEFGSKFVWPLFRLSRAYILCMHRERQRLMNA